MRPKILYLVTEDWYFCSHRLPLAVAAREAGYDVTVVTQVTNHGDVIRESGLRLIPVPFARSARNPFGDLKTLRKICHVYQDEQPDIVHHVAMKPIVYGSLAAAWCHVAHVVNAYTGLGYIFTSNSVSARLLRGVVTRVLRSLTNRRQGWSIVQNPDDQITLIAAGLLVEKRTVLIRGSGVDTQKFAPEQEPVDPPVVVLASRMLWHKGVGEFVEAANRLHKEGVDARFVLVGDSDTENPMAIDPRILEHWRDTGIVEWWGRREEMPAVLNNAHVVCLPSYREGLPKILLEAAACGKPLVATDVPGCREIVRDGDNGLLVPARDAAALTQALRSLIKDPALRRRMGRQGREMVEQHFSLHLVIDQTLDLYQRILASPNGERRV